MEKDEVIDMRLIDADALIEDIRIHSASYFADDFAHEWVDQQPTIEPVRKGKWIEKPNVHGVAYCSLCDYELHTNDTNYCPNCGADMRGEQDDSV